ncbi:unnamed protein product [Symbiodinium necroappetens]|uniref:Uncharacterized protein n=1 Tax=Symbiodinium necroappetens TaxID=1628268 RepID=A0A812KWZ5_9DINO|nr:unnamed protein product [Symbiodinium necroappetens]
MLHCHYPQPSSEKGCGLRRSFFDVPETKIGAARQVGNLADVLPNDWFQNLEAIKLVRSPTLVVHGKVDDLIPLSHGEAGSSQRAFVKVGRVFFLPNFKV